MSANFLFAWCWILAGLTAGTVQGLFFHRDAWMGGYASWPRRMTRLGHIAFLGTALINLLAAISARLWLPTVHSPLLPVASIGLIVGAVSMSTVCYLAAWKKPLRHLFFIPVTTLLGGVTLLIVVLLQSLP